jgi:hypothetical protein
MNLREATTRNKEIKYKEKKSTSGKQKLCKFFTKNISTLFLYHQSTFF